MAYLQVDVDAEQIIDAMREDAPFADQMWRNLAHGLQAGVLLDDACDIFCGKKSDAFGLAQVFESFAESLRSGVTVRGGD